MLRLLKKERLYEWEHCVGKSAKISNHNQLCTHPGNEAVYIKTVPRCRRFRTSHTDKKTTDDHSFLQHPNKHSQTGHKGCKIFGKS